jgi:pimeloyl-ACP methyl ester carboxylesterase
MAVSEAPRSVRLALEGRALWEAGALMPALPLLALAPRGDGHPVLVLPGWLASDRSTLILRGFLRGLGYRAHGWNLDRNEGPTPETREGLTRRLSEIKQRYGRAVSLIGWSLGGIYARELARRFPSDVRQVITLASPFRDLRERFRTPMPVPTTAIYSRTDGVVSWRRCIDDEGPRRENIEVDSSHIGMGHHPRVLLIIADRLAQPEGGWRPFVPRPDSQA